MKFSLCVAEFDPFHNGHKLLLDRMKAEGDVCVVIMSGNFCQRGDAAILNKYTRARHAVLSGADIVIELPTVFATANAEIFAKGAIKLLSAIDGQKTLFFGTETGSREQFGLLAQKAMKESPEFKAALKAQLSTGAPYALARVNALKETEPYIDVDILNNPNSILGLEYVKAIKFFNSDMDFCPVKRDVGYKDDSVRGEICSALAVRRALKEGKKKTIKNCVPKYVYADLTEQLPSADKIAIYKLLSSDKNYLRKLSDCTEGLENRLKALSVDATDVGQLIDKLETRRYTRARLSRIITANMLGIEKAFIERCLRSNLYLKVLAVAKDKKEALALLGGGKHKPITRKADADKLTGTAAHCFEKDAFSCGVYNLISADRCNPYEMKIVDREKA